MTTEMKTDTKATGPLVLMRFRPAWAYIEGIREFGRFFCATTFNASDLADRAQVILQETLENAVKYSSHDLESELELSIRTDGRIIQFSVTSQPDATHLKSLQEELKGLRRLDPEEAYLAACMRAASEPDASARLGLARIRFEGAVELDMNEEEGGRIRLTATGKL